MTERTTVHVMRHGEVHNPEGILYGRLPTSTSPNGDAPRLRPWPAGWPLVTSSTSWPRRWSGRRKPRPPIARHHGLAIDTDDELIESHNVFQGGRRSRRATARCAIRATGGTCATRANQPGG